MEEPGGLLSMGLLRVKHDWSDLAAAASSLFYILFYYDVSQVYYYGTQLGCIAVFYAMYNTHATVHLHKGLGDTFLKLQL